MISEILKENGYSTSMFGKWHLGSTPQNVPNSHGFDEFYGFHSGCVDYYSHIFYWAQEQGVNPVHDLWHNNEEVWNDGRYLTEIITEKSVEYIEGVGDAPFFMYVPYNAPHYPMHAPEKYLNRFPDLSWDRKIMAAMIAAVDDGVGEIVKALKKQNLYEDTLIFFSSDNGPSTESRNWLDGTEDVYYGGSAGHFRGHKGSLFEGGIKEPAILSYPRKFESEQINDEVAVMMDIVPTFMELAEVESKEFPEFDGKSLLKMIEQDTQSPHKEVYWEYNGQLAIRRGEWKLVIKGMIDMDREQPDKLHLSNLNTDPSERVNLVDQYPELCKKLKRSVTEWYSSIGDKETKKDLELNGNTNKLPS